MRIHIHGTKIFYMIVLSTTFPRHTALMVCFPSDLLFIS